MLVEEDVCKGVINTMLNYTDAIFFTTCTFYESYSYTPY